MSKARNYTDKTLKRLFALSGNICAFPDCDKVLVNQKNAKNSNICHIEAASPGGERYNPNMTDEDRADYPNLILLCVQHHDETNDVEKYTVQVLKDMKSKHEALISETLSTKNNIKKYPSILTKVINIISENDIEEYCETLVDNPSEPEDKIKYNDVERYKPIIEEYRVYQGKLNSIYAEIENNGSFKKNNLLRNIRSIYIEGKSKILGEDTTITNIRMHADDLIEYVENKLYKIIDDSDNRLESLDIETISYGVKVILVDSFLRCKILEAVQNDY